MLLQKLTYISTSAQVPVEEWRAALWTQALADQVRYILCWMYACHFASGWNSTIICPMFLLYTMLMHKVNVKY